MPLKLTNDFIFKVVFGQESNKDLLLDLVNAVLADSGQATAVSLILKNPVNLRTARWDKETALDVSAVDATGRVFDIEIQVEPDPNFARRSLYYWARLYSRQITKGHDYLELVPVVCINILGFKLFTESTPAHTCYMIRELNNPDLVLTEDLMIHYIELPKPIKGESRLSVWEHLLANLGTGKEADMTIMFKHDPIMAKVKQQFDHCLEDEQLRDEALAREMYHFDRISQLNGAMETGLKQGLEKGKHENAIMVVRNCKAEGVSMELAARLSGLPLDEVQSIYGE